jgi:hypothetical protein
MILRDKKQKAFIAEKKKIKKTQFVIITAIIAAAILGIYLAFGANPKLLVRLSTSIK